MWDLAHSMGLVIAAWAILALMHIGLGGIVSRAMGLMPRRGRDLFLAFWIGWACTLAGLNIWSLLWPVDWFAFAFFGGVGAAGLVCYGRLFAVPACAGMTRCGARVWIPVLALACVVLFWANQSIGRVRCYDSGLYHFSSIRWAETFPVVPGLGNLHGRLAFNQSSFLYVAMLDWGPLAGHAHNVPNGLLLSAWCAQALWSLGRLFGGSCGSATLGGATSATGAVAPRGKDADLFRVLLTFGILAYVAYSPFVSSPSPDIVALVVGAVLITGFVELLFDEERQEDGGAFSLSFVALIAFVGLTVKLTLAALGIVTVLCALATVLWRSMGSRRAIVRRALLAVGVIALLVCVPWLIRGVILSGYPLYPSRIGAAPVEWRINEEAAADMQKWITSWARQPGLHPRVVLGKWDWLVPWWRRLWMPARLILATWPLMAFILAGGAALLVRLCRKKPSRPHGLPWLILAPPLAAAVFWFFTAPDVRFAGLTFWMLALGAVILLIHEIPEALPRRYPIGVALAICGAVAFYVLSNPAVLDAFRFCRPGPDGGFYPIPRARLTEYSTRSGLKLCVPVKGDLCWDGPLPCTPYPDPRLRLRRENDLGSGFVGGRGAP